jgi:hypothetical protein
MKALDIPKSGKCGDIVASRNRFGSYQRRHFSPTTRRSAAQRRAGSAFGKLSAYWDKLTQEQRQVWRADAWETPSRRRLGRSHRLIGSLLYIKLNYPRVSIGLEPLTKPSKRPQFNPNPVGEFTITNIGGAIALKLSVPERPTAYMMVFGSPPCKAGRSYCSNFSFLGLLPAPEAGVSDITKLYRKKHGLPPVGWRVFIRTKQQVDGWEDDPQQASAIVPAGSASRRSRSAAKKPHRDQ